MWLHAKMHHNGDKTVLTFDQAATEVNTDGQMTLRPTIPLDRAPRCLHDV